MQQIRQIICVGSNYTKGSRIGLRFCLNDTNIDSVIERIENFVGKDGVSIYSITTEDDRIETLKSKDKFFETIKIFDGSDYKGVNEFVQNLNNQIDAKDVVLLLLSLKNMTAVEIIQNIVLIYLVYFRLFNKKMFSEAIVVKNDSLTINKIESEIKNRSKYKDKALFCKNKSAAISKFLNCDGGIELMNKILKIFNIIKNYDSESVNKILFEIKSSLYSQMPLKNQKDKIISFSLKNLYFAITNNNKINWIYEQLK